jgi:glycosyltransferase involved in cell wall biosynthesis
MSGRASASFSSPCYESALMRFACHGFISDGGGSGAGAFTVLLRTLLEQGHTVTFYGLPRFTEPRSLTRFPAYRFVPMAIPAFKPWVALARKLPVPYPLGVVNVIGHIACQREAIRLMETEPPDVTPDCVLCLDALNFWSSRLPVLSWPQSPPQTEWRALRQPVLALSLARTMGPFYLAAVNAFYAYRYAQAKLSLAASDVVLVPSRWSERNWLSFGLPPERVARIPYPLELDDLERVDARAEDGTTTFLWLGRAAPRKRLDLFLSAFDRIRRRRSDVRALLVGKVETDATAAYWLERYRDVPDVSLEMPVPRGNIHRVFSRADVLVQPSQNENFGFSVAESLAASLPVVIGPDNGTADYAGNAGFSFERYDAASVADAMERASAGVRGNRTVIAAEARRLARGAFDRERVAARLLELCERAISTHSARAAGHASAAR